MSDKAVKYSFETVDDVAMLSATGPAGQMREALKRAPIPVEPDGKVAELQVFHLVDTGIADRLRVSINARAIGSVGLARKAGLLKGVYGFWGNVRQMIFQKDLEDDPKVAFTRYGSLSGEFKLQAHVVEPDCDRQKVQAITRAYTGMLAYDLKAHRQATPPLEYTDRVDVNFAPPNSAAVCLQSLEKLSLLQAKHPKPGEDGRRHWDFIGRGLRTIEPPFVYTGAVVAFANAADLLPPPGIFGTVNT